MTRFTQMILLLWLLSCSAGPALAELKPEKLTAATLPATVQPHWVWVGDFSVFHMIDGRSYLIDADTGHFFGMISGGNYHDVLAFNRGRGEIYSTDTYYSRGTRGTRTDVVTIHDARTLSAVAEIALPPKQLIAAPTPVALNLTDDDRFLLQYNFTPAQSVSVVDLEQRKFVGEIESAGCAFVYPGGPRHFQMICAEGRLLTVRLDNEGKAVSRERSAQWFDPLQELLQEDAVRYGSRWYFVSNNGKVFSFDGSGTTPVFDPPWSLVSDAEFQEGWRPGGFQIIAIHEKSGRLYVTMHIGGAGSHREAGTEIWVFDLEQKTRLQRIACKYPARSVQVTQDDNPLLLTATVERPAVEVYDALTGEHLRTIDGPGASTPIALQVPWSGQK